MTKLTITEAVKVIPVSESKLRRDMKAGVVSFEVDEKGKKRFDLSELARVYGQIDFAENNGQVKESKPPLSETGHDNPKVVSLLENQIGDLRNQLEKAETQLQIATTEKTKLLDMLSTEQEKTRLEQEKSRLLMLPASETYTAPERKPNWVQRLLGIQPS